MGEPFIPTYELLVLSVHIKAPDIVMCFLIFTLTLICSIMWEGVYVN